MRPAQGRRQLRAIGEEVARLAWCPSCAAAPGTRCAGSPEVGHATRLQAAADKHRKRTGTSLACLDRLSEAFRAAYLLPPGCAEPEYTERDWTVLWRAAPAANPFFGRGSYWTHSRPWAEFLGAFFDIFHPKALPRVLWQAETSISNRSACDYGELDMTPDQLDRVIRDNPDWPGRRWLLFTEPNSALLPRSLGGAMVADFTQYVYCGKRPVKAERAT
jgi:hypothetical protein